jgi:tetratricopeptide (TPR) repeat protein
MDLLPATDLLFRVSDLWEGLMASDSKARMLREGERYVQQGKITLAINEYLKIIKEEPDDVLTLNTLGDLYLRQSRVGDANQLFMRVADSYARNNFLLKAIAVFKKILNSDPTNLEVNLQLASLFARQGMNVDARNQYMLIGDLYAHAGKANESLEAYEKVVEIDPTNAAMQLKLAETHLEQNNKEKAYLLFAGAARAQMKSGSIAEAMASFRRALAVNWANSEALKGFLETALHAGDLNSALEKIHECVQGFPDDPALQALMGRVYEATGQLEQAERCLHAAIDADDSFFVHVIALSGAFLQSGDPDRALHCLDPIVSILICRREIEKLVAAYDCILEVHPHHLPTLQKLADILSNANDNARYVSTVEQVAQLCQGSGQPVEALNAVERILDANPDSQEHLDLHRELFSQAYPGSPYHLPPGVLDARREPIARLEDSVGSAAAHIGTADSSAASIVEIDLLLNYGLKEKALQLLRTLETARPADLEVRRRLCSLYAESGEHLQAAQQSVLLSALLRKAGDQEAAEKAWSEAKSLAPDWIGAGVDVVAFAREHGIILEQAKPENAVKESKAGLEVDLSGDLSEIFFQAAGEEALALPGQHESGLPGTSDVIAEDFSPEIPRSPVSESAEEQLQEVDFYIRLGFHDEARAKLEEVTAAFPDHPELASRYALLGLEPAPGSGAIAMALPPTGKSKSSAGASDSTTLDILQQGDTEGEDSTCLPAPTGDSLGNGLMAAASQFGENSWFELAEAQPVEIPAVDDGFVLPAIDDSPVFETPVAREPVQEAQANSMFADLIAEVNSLTDQEIAREDFETHYNLGIAYREMGLLEDAIREFQSSVKALNPEKSPREVIQCCGMLSTCFLEKGMARSAIRWCQTGLSIKEISSHETIALRYDMGVAHSSAGDHERAMECFGMIFGIDPSYRDVAQRIDDLKIGLERHAP